MLGIKQRPLSSASLTPNHTVKQRRATATAGSGRDRAIARLKSEFDAVDSQLTGSPSPEWEAMSELLSHFYDRSDSAPFQKAVDVLDYPRYPKVIKKAMDLGLVKRKIANRQLRLCDMGGYKFVSEAADDVRLIWENCMTFNPKSSGYHIRAEELSNEFEDMYSMLLWTTFNNSKDVDRVIDATIVRADDITQTECTVDHQRASAAATTGRNVATSVDQNDEPVNLYSLDKRVADGVPFFPNKTNGQGMMTSHSLKIGDSLSPSSICRRSSISLCTGKKNANKSISPDRSPLGENSPNRPPRSPESASMKPAAPHPKTLKSIFSPAKMRDTIPKRNVEFGSLEVAEYNINSPPTGMTQTHRSDRELCTIPENLYSDGEYKTEIYINAERERLNLERLIARVNEATSIQENLSGESEHMAELRKRSERERLNLERLLARGNDKFIKMETSSDEPTRDPEHLRPERSRLSLRLDKIGGGDITSGVDDYLTDNAALFDDFSREKESSSAYESVVGRALPGSSVSLLRLQSVARGLEHMIQRIEDLTGKGISAKGVAMHMADKGADIVIRDLRSTVEKPSVGGVHKLAHANTPPDFSRPATPSSVSMDDFARQLQRIAEESKADRQATKEDMKLILERLALVDVIMKRQDDMSMKLKSVASDLTPHSGHADRRRHRVPRH